MVSINVKLGLLLVKFHESQQRQHGFHKLRHLYDARVLVNKTALPLGSEIKVDERQKWTRRYELRFFLAEINLYMFVHRKKK